MASGYGRWILNSTYYSAKQRDSQLSYARNAADMAVNNAARELRNADRRIAAQVEQDRQELERRLTAERTRMYSRLSEVNSSLHAELERQRVHFGKETERLRNEAAVIDGRISETENRVSALSEEYERTLGEIVSRVEDQKTRARIYYDRLAALLRDIYLLHPEKLVPGEADVIYDCLAFADSDMENGDYEAAMGVVQSKIPEAAALYSRLELLNDEFSQLVIQVHENAMSISERIENLSDPSKNEALLEDADRKIPYDGRIDFWTSGIFGTVTEGFYDFCDLIRNGYEADMDIEGMRNALAELRAVNSRLDSCVNLAHFEFSESFGVQDLAIRIHNILVGSDSWDLSDSGFADGDERKPFAAIYDDGAGNRAIIVVFQSGSLPERSGAGKTGHGETQFRVNVENVFPGTTAEASEIVRSGILARLKTEGIESGQKERRSESYRLSGSSFLSSALEAGERIRDNRIAYERQRIQMIRG